MRHRVEAQVAHLLMGHIPQGREGRVPETTSFWKAATVQFPPGFELEASHPPCSHLLGSIFGRGRLDVVECAVFPLIWV